MPYQHLMRDPVLFILLAASLVSWAIILERLWTVLRAGRADAAFLRGEHAPASPLAQLREHFAVQTGAGRDHLATVMDTAITLQRQRLERSLPLLGVIGSTAPYVGLLGTVVGIIQAFQSIQAQNNMSPSVVAGGIATALIATGAGLAVAIPAVAAHHLLTAALARRVACWEATVANWLPDEGNVAWPSGKEKRHEPIPFA